MSFEQFVIHFIQLDIRFFQVLHNVHGRITRLKFKYDLTISIQNF